MAGESAQAFALADAPDFGGCIIGTGHDQVTVDLKAADTGLVADEDVLAYAFLEIPNAKGSIP
jgi:hypothetical protein